MSKLEQVEKCVSKENLAARLERQPLIRSRIARLPDVVENTHGDIKHADEAERRALDELRAMGQEMLSGWGQALADQEALATQADGNVTRQVKKLYWFSTFGKATVEEQTFINAGSGKLKRPFQEIAGVVCRGYSLLLQRAITDFGADSVPNEDTPVRTCYRYFE